MADPFMAEQTALMLIKRSMREGGEPQWRDLLHGRTPPMPYWEASRTAVSRCPICGQQCYAKGDYRPAAGLARPNQRWHVDCLAIYQIWTNPTQAAGFLERRQGGLCAVTSEKLNHHAQVDHREPLWRVRRDKHLHSWPSVLSFYGPRNLQLITYRAHAQKSAREAAERAIATEPKVVAESAS